MILKGVAHWACLHEPNTKFDPVYSIDLHIDDAQKKLLEKEFNKIDKGYKRPKIVKQDSGLWLLKIKQKFLDQDGNERPGIPVVDLMKKPMTDLIGNGSIVNVIVFIKPVETKSYGNFVGFYLQKVQVLELVSYNREDFPDVDSSDPVHGVTDKDSDEEF